MVFRYIIVPIAEDTIFCNFLQNESLFDEELNTANLNSTYLLI